MEVFVLSQGPNFDFILVESYKFLNICPEIVCITLELLSSFLIVIIQERTLVIFLYRFPTPINRVTPERKIQRNVA